VIPSACSTKDELAAADTEAILLMTENALEKIMDTRFIVDLLCRQRINDRATTAPDRIANEFYD